MAIISADTYHLLRYSTLRKILRSFVLFSARRRSDALNQLHGVLLARKFAI